MHGNSNMKLYKAIPLNYGTVQLQTLFRAVSRRWNGLDLAMHGIFILTFFILNFLIDGNPFKDI